MKMPMKKVLLAFAGGLAIYLAGAELAQASPGSCSSCEKRHLKSGNCYSDEVTGSRIKRPYRKMGRTVDGADSVLIISQTDIDRSGARDVAGVLRKTVAFAR